MNLTEFGNRLKHLRTENGLKQTQLAALLGLNQLQIAKLESGLARPTVRTLLSLSEHLGVNVDFLFFGEHTQDIRRETDLLYLIKQILTQDPWEQIDTRLMGNGGATDQLTALTG